MKKTFTILNLLSLCFLGFSMRAQTACTGTPASNSVLPNTNTVCTGSAASLSLANNYSTSTGISYQWQSSTVSPVGPFVNIPGAVGNTYTSGSLSGVIFYNVVITCTNSALSISVAHSVVPVQCPSPCSGIPAPTFIIPGPLTVCTGSALNMGLSTNYTNTGISYQWGSATSPMGTYNAISGATLATYNTGILNSNAYYNIIVTCANSSGTFATLDSVTVMTCSNCAGTPSNISVVAASPTICPGGVASMSLINTNTNPAVYYQWQSSTVSAVGPFISIPGATLSTYNSGPITSTQYYNVIINCVNSQTFSVPYTASVVSCNTPSCVANANFSLVPTNTPQVWNAIPASSASIAAVQWSWGDGSTSSTMFTSHQYSAAGMYSICLSVTLTCGASAMSCGSYSVYKSAGIIQVDVVSSENVGLKENVLLNANLQVYPNPNNGQFSIQFNGSSTPTTIEVKNIVGQVVYQTKETGTGKLTKNIDLSQLENGIYFVKISQGVESVTTRISIQK